MIKNISSMESKSYWLKTGHRAQYPELDEDIETDVAVIGAGIAGILTAYHLIEEGKKVALFERFRILNGTTGHTTAKLSAQHGLIYADLVGRYGETRAKRYYEANMGGISEIKKICEKLKLGDLVSDETTYAFTNDSDKVDSFKKEKEIYDKLGIKGELLEKTPLDKPLKIALSMKNQGIFHSVEFLNGVLAATAKKGIKVYENTCINAMNHEHDKIVLKDENDHKITCNHVVFATHYPTIEKDDHFTQLWPRTTQALAYKTDKKLFDGAHISYDTPSLTLRTMEYFGDHYFLIGGQSHITGDGYSDEERYEKIHKLAQELFDVQEPSYKWLTHDLMTKDRVPFIGQFHPEVKNAYVITGLNAWGLANSSAGAMVITDLICGRENPYTKLYDPYREINELEKDDDEEKSSSKVKKVQNPALDKLENDQMTVIEKDEDNENKIGVYKDKNGKLHYLDLSCTHKGCGLEINDGDQTWDCPCHGSRFDKFGKVIYGPAIENLKSVKIDKAKILVMR